MRADSPCPPGPQWAAAWAAPPPPGAAWAGLGISVASCLALALAGAALRSLSSAGQDPEPCCWAQGGAERRAESGQVCPSSSPAGGCGAGPGVDPPARRTTAAAVRPITRAGRASQRLQQERGAGRGAAVGQRSARTSRGAAGSPCPPPALGFGRILRFLAGSGLREAEGRRKEGQPCCCRFSGPQA